MQVFLDDFAMYGHRLEHMTQLRLCLDRCRQARLSLNPAKCAFLVTSGNLLSHIVSQEGIAMEFQLLSPDARLELATHGLTVHCSTN